MFSRGFLLCVVLAAWITPSEKVLSAEPAAGDFYVAQNGKDSWSGKLPAPNAAGTDGPFATLAGARDAIRKLKKAEGPLQRPLQVMLREGVYRLSEPVVFTPEDSGTQLFPGPGFITTYRAWPREKVVFSGGVPITGWKQAEGPLWTAVVPGVKEGRWYPRQLFVNGRRATPARLPNEGTFRAAGPGEEYEHDDAARRNPKTKISLVYQNEDLKPWSNLDDAVVVVYHSWTTSRHVIKSLDPEKRLVTFTAPSGWPMGWWEKNQRYYVEFVREGLDAPGEWYLDRQTGVLLYYPRPGEDMTKAEVIAPRLEELLRLEGDPATGKWVENLWFEGLKFEHTDWTMPRDKPVDGQAAAFLKTAAVFARGARNCKLERCDIAHTGAYGLWLERGCKQNVVGLCHLHDLGAGGVRIGEMGLPEAEAERAERNEVADCFIHDGGHVYHAGVGVWIGKSSHNEVRCNEICDFLYTGVSVGWSWGYAPSSAHHNLIHRNDIHHLGWAELSDLGGIYTLGVSPGTRLADNRIHDVLSYSYGGWGLYTDEGSTGIVLEGNIVYRTKDGCFHQHYGKDNILRNNILAFSATRGQIIRTRAEPHRSFTIERNIILCEPAPPLGGNWTDGNYALDNNIYWKPGGEPQFPGGLTFKQWQEKGQDTHSVVADPKFVDAAKFDFTLERDSPALKRGFEPIFGIGLQDPRWHGVPQQVKRPAMKFPGEE